MKKKVFITGISSELMLNLAQLFDSNSFEIIGLSRRKFKVHGSNIKIIMGDLLKPDSYKQYLPGSDIVIHGAAVTHTTSKSLYYRINHQATEVLAHLAKQAGIQKFVLISSATASKESGAYGHSKLLAERAVTQLFNNFEILRPSEIYGLNKQEGIEKLIKNTMTKSVVFYPSGVPSKLFPIYHSDAERSMYEQIVGTENSNSITYISGPEGFTYLQLVELVKAVTERKFITIKVRRWILFALKWLLNVFPIRIGITPDQISRLYSLKETQPNSAAKHRLISYIKEVYNKR